MCSPSLGPTSSWGKVSVRVLPQASWNSTGDASIPWRQWKGGKLPISCDRLTHLYFWFCQTGIIGMVQDFGSMQIQSMHVRYVVARLHYKSLIEH